MKKIAFVIAAMLAASSAEACGLFGQPPCVQVPAPTTTFQTYDPESWPYNSYEERRKRLRRDYNYRRRVTSPPDFSSEGIPVENWKK